MSIRIETKEIPAQTIETTVITVPATEWRVMKIKYWFFGVLFIVSTFGTIFGYMIFSATMYPEIAYGVGLDVLNNDSAALKGVALLSLSTLPLIFIFWKFNRWLESLTQKLMRKHGWDGESTYRVELEYQTFLHE